MVAFRCGLLNIGAEGQLYVAAFATAWVGIKFGDTVVNVFGKDENWSWMSLPWYVLVPLCVITAVVAGGYGCHPGIAGKVWLARGDQHHNVEFYRHRAGQLFYAVLLKVPGDAIMQSAPIGNAATIPKLNQYLTFLPPDVPLNVAFLWRY